MCDPWIARSGEIGNLIRELPFESNSVPLPDSGFPHRRNPSVVPVIGEKNMSREEQGRKLKYTSAEQKVTENELTKYMKLGIPGMGTTAFIPLERATAEMRVRKRMRVFHGPNESFSVGRDDLQLFGGQCFATTENNAVHTRSRKLTRKNQ